MVPSFTIGILKETQSDPDARVAITPDDAQKLLSINKSLTILVQPSEVRCFSEEEYIDAGCIISDDLSDCDLLLGIKEVDKNTLIRGKKYMFFSHTAKKQVHNQALLQAVIDKNITLIDYEFLYGEKKRRIAAFGYFAGLAGAYNTIRAYGIKKELFDLLTLKQITNKVQMFKELKKVVGMHEKILITGSGRVASGVEEVLQVCQIFKVDSDGFFNKTFRDPVYFVADPTHYAKHKQGLPFTFKDYKKQPKEFKSNFLRFAEVADIFIAAHYWDSKAPRLFNTDDVRSDLFKIDIIGDITCDINGSVPTTIKDVPIEESYYDFNKSTLKEEKAFSGIDNITVMAVSKLPSVLAKEASVHFSNQLVNHILEYFWMGDYNKVLKKATIAKNGKIKRRYAHLRTFVQENLYK